MTPAFSVVCVALYLILLKRGFNIPWVGGENTIGMGFDIPWIRGSIFQG
jgi:hypothetical protein